MDQGSLTSSKVQFFFSCRKLKDVDFIGVSDPFIVMSMRENPA